MSQNLDQRRQTFAITFAAMSLLVFALYFAYDIPEVDASNLDTHVQTGLRDAWVFIPGIFMAFGAGVLVDRIGLRLGGVMAAGLACGGTLLSFLYSGTHRTPDEMLVGRFLFGVGMEPATVVAITALQITANPRRVGLFLALFAASGRLGSFLVDSIPTWRASPRVHALRVGVDQHLHGTAGVGVVWDAIRGRLPWLVATIFLFVAFLAMVYFWLKVPAGNKIANGKQERTVFPGGFWPLVIVCTAAYAPIYAARAYGLVFMRDLGLDEASRGFYQSLTSSIPLLLTAFFGWVADRMRFALLIAGAATLVVGFALLFFEIPRGAYAVIGFAYAALPAAIWPSLKDCVEESRLGFSNGMMTAVQNGGMALLLFLTGYSNDHYDPDYVDGYKLGHALLLGSTILCLGSAIIYVRTRVAIRIPENRADAVRA